MFLGRYGVAFFLLCLTLVSTAKTQTSIDKISTPKLPDDVFDNSASTVGSSDGSITHDKSDPEEYFSSLHKRAPGRGASASNKGKSVAEDYSSQDFYEERYRSSDDHDHDRSTSKTDRTRRKGKQKAVQEDSSDTESDSRTKHSKDLFKKHLEELTIQSYYHPEDHKRRLAAFKADMKSTGWVPETPIAKPWREAKYRDRVDGVYSLHLPEEIKKIRWHRLQQSRAEAKGEIVKGQIHHFASVDKEYKNRALSDQNPRPAYDLQDYYWQKHAEELGSLIKQTIITAQRPHVRRTPSKGENYEKYLFWNQVAKQKSDVQEVERRAF
ncbi:hypothetical protein CBS101457_003303 [Exobasidium rhododendri]|nr:hypothetical protein CBS101457_003303 [Exobasidium rhododendri]